jgi:molecular chaperone DnaJ
MEQDYYNTLGVNRDSSADEIKKAYRKLAMKYHPDRNPGDNAAEEKFKSAAEAYEVLGDLEKRKIYDRYGAEGLRSSGYSGPGNFEDIFSSFGDIFGDLFGFGGTRRQPRQGPIPGNDLRYDLTISFMDAVHGIDKEIDITKRDTCWTCEGSGIRPGYKSQTCPHCHGSGQVTRTQGFFSVRTPCSQCHGQGEIVTDPCEDCNGSGLVSKNKKVSVKIPPGVDNGARMRLRSEGEGGRKGGQPGDLYIVIHVEPHDFFQRENDLIYCRFPLGMAQAALGCTLEVPTIYGKKKLTVPKGTQPGDTFRLRGEGVASLRGHGKGDMVIEIQVIIPEKINKRQRELLEEFAEIESGDSGHHHESFLKKIFKGLGIDDDEKEF